MADRRRTFAPVLFIGVSAAVVTAVASSRDLVRVGAFLLPGDGSALGPGGANDLPLATTLSMVVLAAWGVVLVTRGRVRRAVAVLGALASSGVLATVVAGWWQLPDGVSDELARVGARPEIELTAWYWVALGAAVLSAAASVAAVWLVPAWPEMGDKYDRPTGPPAEQADDDLALWKALDEGRDPTA